MDKLLTSGPFVASNLLLAILPIHVHAWLSAYPYGIKLLDAILGLGSLVGRGRPRRESRSLLGVGHLVIVSMSVLYDVVVIVDNVGESKELSQIRDGYGSSIYAPLSRRSLCEDASASFQRVDNLLQESLLAGQRASHIPGPVPRYSVLLLGRLPGNTLFSDCGL